MELIMADRADDGYPRLPLESIPELDAVFRTHSHADHTGAIPWLLQHGFTGTVVAFGETLRQLSLNLKKVIPLEDI